MSLSPGLWRWFASFVSDGRIATRERYVHSNTPFYVALFHLIYFGCALKAIDKWMHRRQKKLSVTERMMEHQRENKVTCEASATNTIVPQKKTYVLAGEEF